MDNQRKKRLQPLLNDVPPGFLVDAAWLAMRDINRKSIFNYERRGWLNRVARSLYCRPPGGSNAVLDWKKVVLSMQRLMNYDVHVGGRTALDLQGYEHYVRFDDDRPIHLYGRPPSWLKRTDSVDRYMVHTRALFGAELVGVDESPTDEGAHWNWSLTLSTPERAILEVLDELPSRETFHIADTLFEGLNSVRPILLDKLLRICRRKHVKRLFFVFADRHSHAWRKYVKPENYDLGSGPRAFYKGGRFHPDYKISVPEDFLPYTTRNTSVPENL